jgi:hypothetical protein
MIRRTTGRPLLRLAIGLALLAGIVPLSVSADHHVATRTTATFNSTVVEFVEPGEEWQDEAGIFHLRGETTLEDVTGDIAGSAVVVVNVDFWAPGECTEESCPGYVEVWGIVEITGENGWWEGRFTQSFSDVPDDEYAFTSIALHGHGGYAGMSFFGEFVGEDETSVTIEGTISTMATPIQNLDLNVTVCFTETGAAGNYLGTGTVDGFGQAEAVFIGSGFQWTHTYNLFGAIELSDESGSFIVGFVSGAQDIGFVSHGFGSFVITEGTGAYAELYGNGRLVGSAVLLPQCDSGFGVRLSLIGEAHYN